MLGIIQNFYSEKKTMFVLLAAAGILTLFSLILVLTNISTLASPVVIHFDKFRGIDSLGGKSDVWGIWAGGLALFAVNSVLSGVFYKRERVLAYVFAGAALLLSVLVLVALGVIFSVN